MSLCIIGANKYPPRIFNDIKVVITDYFTSGKKHLNII